MAKDLVFVLILAIIYVSAPAMGQLPPPTMPLGSGFPTMPAGSGFPTMPPGSGFPTMPAGSGFPTMPPGSGFPTMPPGSGFPTMPPGSGFPGTGMPSRPPGSGFPTMPPMMPNGSPFPTLPGGSMDGGFPAAGFQSAAPDLKCTASILQSVLMACQSVAMLTPQNVETTIKSVCDNPDSACMRAVKTLVPSDCVRTTDPSVRGLAPSIIPMIMTMCLKGNQGQYCLVDAMKAKTETDAKCSPLAAAECSANSACVWIGRCVVVPTAIQMQAQCGDCAAKLARARAEATGVATGAIGQVAGSTMPGGAPMPGGAAPSMPGMASSMPGNMMSSMPGTSMPGQQPQAQQPQQDNGGLMCAKDAAGNFCLPQKLTTLPPMTVTSVAELATLTSDVLQKSCVAKQLDECSRLLQPLLTANAQSASTTSFRLQPEHACARAQDGSFCLPAITKALTADVIACFTAINSGPCSATCATSIQTALKGMGCCASAANNLLTQIMFRGAQTMDTVMSRVRKCAGLENVGVLVQQSCDGLANAGDNGAVPEVKFTINVPCTLLDVNRVALTDALVADIARFAGVDTSQIQGTRLACATNYKVTLTTAAHARRSFGSLAETTLWSTTVYFRVAAGERSADAAASVKKQLDNPANLAFTSLAAVVKAQCVDCPVIGVQGAIRTADNTELAKAATKNACDPVLFMDVVTSCSSVLSKMESLDDAAALTLAKSTCSATGACVKALKAIGDKNLMNCDASTIGGPAMLVYLRTMCSMDGETPCLFYLREADGDKTCGKLKSSSTCAANTKCTWDSNECRYKRTQASLEGFCGNCKRQIVDAAALAAGLNAGKAVMPIGEMELMCTKVGTTYCEPILQSRAASSTNKMFPMSDLCDNTVNARCFKMVMYMKAKAMKDEADLMCGNGDSTCLSSMGNAKLELERSDFLLQSACTKDTDEKYCIDKITNFNDSSAVACLGAAVSSTTCPTTCQSTLTSTIDNFGCCLPVIQQWLALKEKSVKDVVAVSASAAPGQSVVGLLAARSCVPDIATKVQEKSCAKPPAKVHHKQLGLKLRCALLTDEVKAALKESVPKDISSAIAVPIESIKNVDPTCNADVQVDTTAGASAAHHSFQVLATESGVAVKYDLQSTNDFETERVSTELDSKTQSGELTLPSTQTSVSGVCSSCGALEVDKTSSKTLSVTDGSSGALSTTAKALFVLAVAVVMSVL